MKIITQKTLVKRIFLASLFIASLSVKSQTPSATCTGMAFLVDYTHYNVLPTHDSTFVKYVKFNLSDTSTVSKISYTFSDVTTGTAVQQTQQDYYLQTTVNSSNLTVANNYIRNNQTVKISFGYFSYQSKKYLVNVKLYNSGNTLLSSTNYNFSH